MGAKSDLVKGALDLTAKLLGEGGQQAAKTGIIPGTFPGKKLPNIDALSRNVDKFVYHSGVADDIPGMKYGIDPQIGPWVKEVLEGSAEDDLVNEIMENSVPVSWWSKRPDWAVMKVARKLGKSPADITPEELAQHGHVALVPKKDPEAEHMYWVGEEGLSSGPYSEVEDITGRKLKAYDADLYSGNYGPEGVEKNEYITPRSVEPYLHLTGDDLVNFLRKTGNYNKSSGGSVREGYSGKGRVVGNIVDQALKLVAGSEPQKTVKAYKLFRQEDGKLFPLFVDAKEEVAIGNWLKAKAGETAASGKVKSKIGPLAYRPGWHAGDLPIATHIGARSHGDPKLPPDTRPSNQVWAEIEMADDVDWQKVADERARITKKGTPDPKTAHITDQVPYGGYYRYKTNPNMTGNWMIGGDMRVNRVLTDDEVKAINEAAGVSDLPRREGYAGKGRVIEKGLEVAADALGIGKRAPNQVFPELAERYPEVGAPVKAFDKKTGKEYLAKSLSPEAEAFKSARDIIQKDIDAGRYNPFFDVSKRADVDPSFYPSEGKTIDVMPKKQETRAKYRAMAFDPEGLSRLRAGYEAGLTQKEAAENWYFMKQLEDQFVNELGEEEGRKQFKNRFAKAMALTTGGADPTSNLLMAYYGNYLKNKGLDVPQAAFDMPYPIGGRYASSNMSMFERNYGNELSPDNPKRLNFQNNFLGYKEPTIDEQMSKGFDPKLQMPEWYGPYEEAINTLAKEYNVDPRYFQEVTWAGLKSQGKAGYKSVPMIQNVNEAIERTSRLTGVSPEEVVRRGLVRAEMPIYSVAPVAGAAAVGAMGEEDQDTAIDEALTIAKASGGSVEREGYSGRGRVLSTLGKGVMELLGPSERRGLLELTPPGSGYKGVPGKPSTVKLPGIGEAEARPIPGIMEAAEKFSALRGLPGKHEISEFPALDEAFAMRVADAYDRMKHAPSDPAVRRSYDAMAQETLDQLKAAEDAGIEFTAIRGKDPYAASPALGYADIAERGNLYFFPTDAGFGSSIEFDPSQNPLLKRIGRVGDLDNATVNDAFRIVHDLYGHYGPGNPFFRAPGEERAYLLHRRMYSPEALPAMTSETRGQNSWLNYGPHGPRNRTAASEDTVFADQKTGVMEPFTYLERADGGAVDDALRIAKEEGGGLTPYADDPSFRFRENWMAAQPDSPEVREMATSMTDESLQKLFAQVQADERAAAGMTERGYEPVPQNAQGEITSRTPSLREDIYANLPTDLSRNVATSMAPVGDAFNFLTGLENYADANYRFARTGETPSAEDRAYLALDMAPGIVAAAAKPIARGVKAAAEAVNPIVAGGLAGAGALTLGSEEAEAGKLNLFSRLNQAVEALPMEKMTSEQALAALTKAVPASELRWTGMLDYLKSNPKVTKAAMAEFAQRNAVVPEETVIGGGIYNRNQVIPREEIKEKYRDEVNRLSSAEMRMASMGLTDQARTFADQRQKLYDQMINEEIEMMGGLERRPQYKQWSSPGEDVGTYREHVFTMPGNEYVSSHYKDMPGYIGHMRTTQFSTPQGRVFVMDEAQSDLAQDLRREGEVAKPEYRIVDQGGYYAAELMDGSGAMRGGYGTPEQAREAGEEMARKRARKAAPYTESTSEWTDLALKRGLQAATEADAKFFAWPPGSVQSARYDLEKQAEAIDFKYNPFSNRYSVGVSYGNNMGDDLLENATPEEVRRAVGDTVYEKIMKATNTEGFDPEEYHSIPTRGLTIGGEGMKKYYDEIVPKRIQEVVRKATGVKVKPEKVKVPTAEGEMEYWGIPLTDEIKRAKWSSFSSGGEVVDRALALTSEV